MKNLNLKMKNLLIILFSLTFLFGCSSNKTELYEITDYFVESLVTTYDSYGMTGMKHSKTTESGLYKVTPFGRLINVKIQEAVSNDVYEDLKEDLESHYRNDERVNDVYINQGGTIMIDCRN